MYGSTGVHRPVWLAALLGWGAAAGLVATASAVIGYQLAIQSIRIGSDLSVSNVQSAMPASSSSSARLASEMPTRPSEGQASGPAKASRDKPDSSPLTWPLWEFRLQDPLPSREQPLTPVPWRVLGAALFDGRWQAIVQRQGAASPEYYKIGDKLPGGFVIQNITQEDMTLRAGRREIVLAYIGSR